MLRSYGPKTQVFTHLYGDAPRDRMQDEDQVERMRQRIDNWVCPHLPDYSQVEIRLLAHQMEKRTPTMNEQAIDLETGRLYDGGQIPPWAIRLTEPVGLRSWCRYLQYGKIEVGANRREAGYTQDDRIHFVHRASNAQEAVTGVLTRLAAGDPHGVFSSTPPGFNDHAVAIVRSDRVKDAVLQSGEYEIVYETDLPGLTGATLFWLQGSVLFPRFNIEKPTITLVKDTATNRWAIHPRTQWADPEENWIDPLRGVLNLLICVDSEKYKSHMKALQEARRFYSDTFNTKEMMPGIQSDPPYTAIVKDRLDTKGKHPLQSITLSFRVEKNHQPSLATPKVAPFRPEEFRTTQHLGGMGLANMRHPAFERPTPPAKVDKTQAAVQVTTAWSVDTTPQAIDRQARFRHALASVIPAREDIDLTTIPQALARPLGELRLVMVVEAYGLIFRDCMDPARHPGYSMSLRLTTNPTALNIRMEDIRRALTDTLRDIAWGHSAGV